MAVEPVCSAPAPSCMKPAAAPLTRTSTPTQPPVAVPSPALAPIRISTPTTSPTGAPSSVMHPHFIPRSFAQSERLRPVDEFLLGLGLRSEELVSCTAGLLWFDDLGGSEAQARRCFERFLFADMSTCRAGVLPEGVGSMYATVLDGPFVLQVQHCIFAQWETDEYASLSIEYVNQYSQKSLRVLGSVGEPINPTAWRWFYNVIGDSRCPISDPWCQTETGGFMATFIDFCIDVEHAREHDHMHLSELTTHILALIHRPWGL